MPEKLKKRLKSISSLWKIDSLNINEILRLATRSSLRQRWTYFELRSWSRLVWRRERSTRGRHWRRGRKPSTSTNKDWMIWEEVSYSSKRDTAKRNRYRPKAKIPHNNIVSRSHQLTNHFFIVSCLHQHYNNNNIVSRLHRLTNYCKLLIPAYQLYYYPVCYCNLR